jgi:FkbM family methyltransferase
MIRDQVATVRRLVQALGIAETMKVVIYRLLGFKKVSVHVKGIKSRVLVRMNNCDLPLLSDVFCSDECEVGLSWTPQTVIDLGANIGLTALKLRNQFPLARMIAVEPDTDTAKVCASNLKHVPDCIVLHRAVGFEAARVVCTNPQAQAISRQFGACNGEALGSVGTITVGTILDQYECRAPILVKMDIEGAEEECFQHAEEWLGNVDAVLCEPHSKLVETEIYNKLTKHGFSIRRIGEKICGERAMVGPAHG